MRTCALIPAFNEVPYIADVVKGTQPHVEKVVVIDDGSGDGTGQAARAAGATCLHSPTNCGKAFALRAAKIEVDHDNYPGAYEAMREFAEPGSTAVH